MKNYLILGLFIGLFSYNANTQTLTDSLMCYYTFSGQALDQSGNNHHGIVHGAVLTTDRFGNPNSAYEFNGINSWINTNFSFDYRYRTVSVWANPYSTAGYNTTSKSVFSQDASTLNYGFFLANYENGSLILRAGGESTSPNLTGLINNWIHIVLVRDSLSCSYYVNGNLIGTATCGTLGSSYNPNPNLVIGTGRATTNQFFSGKIDDIRIYSRALTPEEIITIYNEQPTQISELLPGNTHISVYPNPASCYVKLKFENPGHDELTFVLLDLQGHAIKTIDGVTTEEMNIETDNLLAGLYLFQIHSGNQIIYSGKFVVE